MKVLFTPYCGGSIAHVVRSLAVADELRSRGHEVAFTASVSRKDFIQQAGYAVASPGHPDVNLNDENDQSEGYFDRHSDRFLEWFRDEISVAEAFRPDVIVNSPAFFGQVAARRLGIPHVTILNGNWHPQYVGVLGLSKCRATAGDRVMRRILKPLVRRAFDRKYLPYVRRWYDALGVTDPAETRADLHEGATIIIPGVPSLEPLTTGDARTHYVGPLQWDGFEQAELDLPFASATKPLVYLSLGGSVFRQRTYEDLIGVFSRQIDWNIAVSIGPNFDRAHMPNDLPHVLVRQYLPGLAVCRQADLVVNTASHGTVMQALGAGKPMVVLPRNIDQSTFAARLTELGAAVNLNPVGVAKFSRREVYVEQANGLDAGLVVAGVHQVLGCEQSRRAATSLQQEIEGYSNPSARAAEIVEGVGSGTL